MTYLPPLRPGIPNNCRDQETADHGWIVAHLIGLIGYCETEGLAEVEQALIEATERLAPILNGHRLARLRAEQARPIQAAASDIAATILQLPPATGMEHRHAPT